MDDEKSDAQVTPTARAVAGKTLEFAVPLELLRDAKPGQRLSFFVIVSRREGDQLVEVERHSIEVVMPGPDFDAAHWRV